MRKIQSAILATALVTIYAGPVWAAATPLPVTYSPADLAAEKIPLPASIDSVWTNAGNNPVATKEGDAGGGGAVCNLKVDATNKFFLKEGSACAKLWDRGTLDKITFAVTTPNVLAKNDKITFEPVAVDVDGPIPVMQDGNDTFKFDGVKLPTEAAVYFSDFSETKGWEWEGVKPDSNGVFRVPFGKGGAVNKEVVAYANFDKSGQSNHWTTIKLKPKPPEVVNKPITGGTNPPKVKYEGFCPSNVPSDESTKYTVCLDLYEDQDDDALENGSGGAFRFFPETRGHVLLPNRAIVVRVRHPRGSRVTISMDGKRGLTRGSVDNQIPDRNGNVVQSDSPGSSSPQEIADAISEVSFGPRLPGESDIKVVLENVVKGVSSTYRTEVTVEELYIGAFRLGLGPVFQGAVERSYAAEVLPGSQQAQIVAKTSGQTDLELVLGFAPYLLDYYQRGGRASISRRTSYVAPYVGLGLVNANENSLELLKSLHLGAELELSPGFSFAATFVMRRVTRLADGYQVGMPVNGNDVPTTTGYNWGWGLVANFSPEFFKIATTSSSKFFK